MLAGLGQQASPPHSLWICSQLLSQLEMLVVGQTSIRPRQVLDQYLEKIRMQAREIVDFHQPKTPVVQNAQESALEDVPIAPSSSQIGRPVDVVPPEESLWKHFGCDSSFSLFEEENGTPLVVRLSSPFLTVGNLRAAEVGLLPVVENYAVIDPNSRLELSNDTYLAGRCIMFCSLDELSPASVSGSQQPDESVM